MLKYALTIYLTLFSFSCVAEQLVDPTMPATYSAAKTVVTTEDEQQVITYTNKKLVLNSTFIASEHKVAIINGVQFKIGDEISDGSTLQSITHQQVNLKQQDGSIISLSLQKSFISDMK